MGVKHAGIFMQLVHQRDGKINDAVNGDVSSQLHKDLNGKDDEDDGTLKQNDDIERSTSAIHEPKVERRPFDEKLLESVVDSSEIHDPKPKETPIPNSRHNTPPNLRPFLAPAPTRLAGLGRGALLLEPAHRVVQSPASEYVYDKVISELCSTEQQVCIGMFKSEVVIFHTF
ncbi:hypothetical protein Tco_0788287 [Tanacetum coccineum]